ncbi:protein of unknown function [Burkholderia multivorans]
MVQHDAPDRIQAHACLSDDAAAVLFGGGLGRVDLVDQAGQLTPAVRAAVPSLPITASCHPCGVTSSNACC